MHKFYLQINAKGARFFPRVAIMNGYHYFLISLKNIEYF